MSSGPAKKQRKEKVMMLTNFATVLMLAMVVVSAVCGLTSLKNGHHVG